ncbi:MAG: hypothetical protein PVF51_00950 [Nitrospirota bacterium]|jgi:hypothetical protein
MRNSKARNLWRVVVLGAILVLASEDGMALPGRGPCAADWDAQVTITGTVETPVMLAPCPRGRRDLTYTYIDATGDDGQSRHWYVMLGPASGPDQPLRLNEGEKVTVTGAPVDDDLVVAASIERDGKVVRLRDSTGRPAWRGGRWTGDGHPPCSSRARERRGGPRSW